MRLGPWAGKGLRAMPGWCRNSGVRPGDRLGYCRHAGHDLRVYQVWGAFVSDRALAAGPLRACSITASLQALFHIESISESGVPIASSICPSTRRATQPFLRKELLTHANAFVNTGVKGAAGAEGG